MFQQLKVQMDTYPLSFGDFMIGYGRGAPTIQYHTFTGDKLIMNLIPERYREHFNVNVMEVSQSVLPHTDSNILTTINHYIETNDAETIFYKVVNDNLKYQGERQTTGYIFLENAVERVSSFVAKDNEVWILDVTKPHSVTMQGAGKRVAVALQTIHYSYDEVVEMLKETNCL